MACDGISPSIIKRCIDRDPDAWDEFVRGFRPLILSSIRIRLHKYGLSAGAHDIEDIVQEVLSKIWEGGLLGEIRNPESVKYWLSIVSGNTALKYMRRRGRLDRGSVSLASLDESALSAISGVPQCCDVSHESPDSMQDGLARALDSLPGNELMALKLNILYGKSYAEIAETMSVPLGTVSSLIARAKDRLRNRLGGKKF